jgi:hypothetical protein
MPAVILNSFPFGRDLNGKKFDFRECPTVGIDIAESAILRFYERHGSHHPSMHLMANHWRALRVQSLTALLPEELQLLDSPTATEAYLAMRLIDGIQAEDVKQF